MKKTLVAVFVLASALTSALTSTPSFAQPVERVAVERPAVAAPAPTSAVERPAVAPTPKKVAEPKNGQEFVELLIVTAAAARMAMAVGTLGAIALAALCATYLAMFLAKTALKMSLPEQYKKVLTGLLTLLSVVAGVLGFVAAGIPGAVVAGAGAAASGPVHDVLDGVRAIKLLKKT